MPLFPLISANPPPPPLTSNCMIQVNAIEELREMAIELLEMGPRAVLLKGGRHKEGYWPLTEGDLWSKDRMVDVYADLRNGAMVLEYPHVATSNTHGAGCTLAAAIAAELAKQIHKAEGGGRGDAGARKKATLDTLAAVTAARAYLHGVFEASQHVHVGTGLRGPLNHARVALPDREVQAREREQRAESIEVSLSLLPFVAYIYVWHTPTVSYMEHTPIHLLKPWHTFWMWTHTHTHDDTHTS